MTEMKDFGALLKSAKLPERTVEICLRGDLVAEHELAERELEQVQKAVSDSLAGNGASAIAGRIEELEAQMREHTYDFRLRALPRPAWRALIAEHPPRRGDDNEIVLADRMGVNAETFFEAMIRKAVIDPVLTDEQFAQLLDALTDRQFGDLSDVAWGLNRHEVDVPFSRAASRMRRASGDE